MTKAQRETSQEVRVETVRHLTCGYVPSERRTPISTRGEALRQSAQRAVRYADTSQRTPLANHRGPSHSSARGGHTTTPTTKIRVPQPYSDNIEMNPPTPHNTPNTSATKITGTTPLDTTTHDSAIRFHYGAN